MGKNCHNLVYLFLFRQNYENFMQKLPKFVEILFFARPRLLLCTYTKTNSVQLQCLLQLTLYVGKCCPFRTIYVTQYLKLMLACLFIPCTFIVFCESSHVRTTSGWDLVIFISTFLLTLLYNLECQNLCNALFVDIELQVVIRIFIFMPNFLYIVS